MAQGLPIGGGRKRFALGPVQDLKVFSMSGGLFFFGHPLYFSVF